MFAVRVQREQPAVSVFLGLHAEASSVRSEHRLRQPNLHRIPQYLRHGNRPCREAVFEELVGAVVAVWSGVGKATGASFAA